eukprot:2074754-Pyramimonas_sp.AAC.1
MARIAPLHPRARDQQPIFVALDFGQAFPSLSQQCLFTVLKRLRLPDALFSACCSIYASVTAVGRLGGITTDLFAIERGIIQGCALPGSLFAAAALPFLEDLRLGLEIKHRGLFRACADDIGGVLFALVDLRFLAR